jgi:class 3 adenylate cyclase/tetratricopeptide (TPR) repeat protein
VTVVPPGSVDPLLPYVPRLVYEWLRDVPELEYRSIPGSLAFCDISGFTNLTERLSRRGKAGAEEMGDVLNATFEELLAAAYDYGAGLVKWGGDAVLLLFTGDEHPLRACRAAAEIQEVMRRISRTQTSVGVVRLAMSIGVHSGDLDFFLVGQEYRELLVSGPEASMVTRMETIAEAGEIVISTATANCLEQQSPNCLGAPKDIGRLLVKGPDVARLPNRSEPEATIDLTMALPPGFCEYVRSGAVEYEHRQVVAGFVEFSGSDALLEDEGPESLTNAIRHVTDICQKAARDNGVTILSSDVYEDGGKFLLVSGAPRSQGDGEARVLGACRAIIDAQGVLPLRAGINTGRVFAGDYGPFYRRTYSITGDSVNLAARLMAKAKHGEIVVAPAVLERAHTSFELTPMEPFMVKGKSEPIEAFLVGAVSTRSNAAQHRRTPFVGRTGELGLLRACAASAGVGDGQAVELIGPPGIGKSRLLDEFIAGVPYTVLFADGDVYGTATPYQPLHRLFRRQLGLADDAEPPLVVRALTELVDQVAPHLAPWLPLIGIVAGADFEETPEVAALDPEARRERLEQTTSEALALLLAEPTVFIFNDMHFMDEATTQLLRQLAIDVGGRPWLIIATRRPETAESLLGVKGLHRIVLEPLNVGTSDQIVAALTENIALPAHRVAALIDRAGGNPLFLQELIAAAVELGDPDSLPDSIEGVITARIDHLAPAQRRVLRSASVLGMNVDLSLLKAITHPEAELQGHAAVTMEGLGEFLVPQDGDSVRFAHHLIRDAAYEGLPYRRRTLLHARTADLLERNGLTRSEHPDLLSFHCFHGARFNAAWEYSCVAGSRARERYAYADAVDCYRRALAAAKHVPSLGDRELARVLESVGDIYFSIGELASAEASLSEASARTRNDPAYLGQIRLKMATVKEANGELSTALKWISRGRTAVKNLSDSEAERVRAQLSARYARIRYLQGRYKEARSWAEQAQLEAAHAGDKRSLAYALEVLDNIEAWTGNLGGEAPILGALEIYQELGDVCAQGRAYVGLGARAYFQGQWNEALDAYAKGEEALRKGGREWDAATASANQAEIEIEQGHSSQAEERLQRAMRVWRGAQAPSEIAYGNNLLGRAATKGRRFDEAMSYFDDARAYLLAAGETHEVLDVDAARARCYLESGDPEAALRLAEATLSASHRLEGTPTAISELQCVRGEALLELTRYEEGLASLRESLAIARQRQSRYEIARALQALLRAGAERGTPTGAAWEEERRSLFDLLGIDEPVRTP